MILIKWYIVLLSFLILDARYSVYHSNGLWGSELTFDCLYYYLIVYDTDQITFHSINYNMIPYCRRLHRNDFLQPLESIVSYENVKDNISFSELYHKGVTSEQLLDWSAPIELAERYEKEGQNSNEIFHNCSLPWFGSMCQYRVDSRTSIPFHDLLYFIFQKHVMGPLSLKLKNITCYSFLPGCQRGPSTLCLDWRDICNGYVDCINGEDEEFCQILEVNQCTNDEYRCHFGGQCIPSAFVRDGTTSVDCLDGTDETVPYDTTSFSPKSCIYNPIFRCEEYKGRNRFYFNCGDGTVLNRLTPSFTHGCHNDRDKLITLRMFNSLNYISDMNCQQLFYCSLRIYEIHRSFLNNAHIRCESFINNCSLKWLVWPEYPNLYGYFQFIYFTNRSIADLKRNLMPDFICFNVSRCPAMISCNVNFGFNIDIRCCQTIHLTNSTLKDWNTDLYLILKDLLLQCLTIGTDHVCSHPALFHCQRSSKCISKYRVKDGENDCYFGEDELYSACRYNDSWRFTCESENDTCLSLITVGDGKNDCQNGDDEWNEYQRYLWNRNIPFAAFCNGIIDLNWINISNETDETHCEWWPCNNPNSQCDQSWDCLNGVDELNCPNSNCLFNEHECIGVFGNENTCISINHLIEKYSSWKAPLLYRKIYRNNVTRENFTQYFLWNETKCITAEHISSNKSLLSKIENDICLVQTEIPPPYRILPVVLKDGDYDILCGLGAANSVSIKRRISLRPSRLGYFPPISSVVPIQRTAQSNQITYKLEPTVEYFWYCNRGIYLFVKNNKTVTCLCPPSYFGDQCQWQNQRISLTIQLAYRATKFIMAVFQIIIMLIDEHKQISSYHEQIIYVPSRDCGTKFNIYLLYPDQPKNTTANYSIHIDVFDKITLTYWASWHLSIPFQFLPVNRIAAQLFIPDSQQLESCPLLCGNHGKCKRYVNKNFSYFCQCDQGFSGMECNIKENCSCASDSFCHTSSICICPLHKYGPKCYLKHSICQLSNNPCENDGLCVPIDDRIDRNAFTCLCKASYFGTRCENMKSRIDIKVDEKTIEASTAMFIHLITGFDEVQHQRITTFKKIKYNENTITIYVTHPFHIVIGELFNRSYYLLVLREIFIKSEYIRTELIPNQKCTHVDDLLNVTYRSYSHLRLVKYYPLLCRQNLQLKCFYDKKYICICDIDRFSNCFLFNHSLTYDCKGYNNCENGGQCFQDNVTCPSLLVCVCPDCYYGTKCQFSTSGFVLSLDYILGYHIKPNVSFSRLPTIIKMSAAMTTTMFVFGSISGILSVLTFRMKKTRDMGCGLYLLVSSWISILIVSVLLIKFWQLVLSQMAIITNRTMLTLNCILLDMILQILLTSNDWLDACVSTERILTVIKNTKFNKTISKKLAKWIALSVIIVTVITHLHMPFHRNLIDDIDADEQRTWCLVRYSKSMSIFNSFITLCHFLIPLLINLISIGFIIIFIARTRFNLQPRLTFKQHLQLQFRQNKHHLIASCSLVLLALPRLIISFIRGCMKSPRHSWLFLFGYLISFLPSTMKFFAYVLPSKIYKEEFESVMRKTIQRLRMNRFD